MRILYVEDDPGDADLTIRKLRKSMPDWRVESVNSVSTALGRLGKLGRDALDLALIDMRLPDGSGLDLLAHIRNLALPIAVVIITGFGDEEAAVSALKAGANDYVVKRKDYIERLPLMLQSALYQYRADALRRSHPLNVLYAEHNFADTDLTLRHLAAHAPHIHLDVVSTGLEALNRINSRGESEAYNVVLLDYRLPGLDALDVLKEVRLSEHSDLPVVLVTGQGDEEIANQAMKLGASSYIVKSPGYLYKLPPELENANLQAELTRREKALRRSEERYKLATLAGGVGVWDWDLRTGQMYIDPVLKSFLGFEDHEIHNRIDDWIRYVDPLDVDAVMRKANAYVAGETEQYEVEHRRLCKDGSVRWFLGRGTVVRDEHGAAARLVGTDTDITQRKQAEAALQDTLAELKELKDRLQEENVYLQEAIQVAHNFGEIIGHSDALKRTLRQAEQVAPLDTTVLITGETGTGKELLAHAIHRLSPRRNRPMVNLNCATLPAHLIESELFGHEKGAFTGAVARRSGRFEIANGGTIFLDEIGELPLDLQVKLLRVLQEGEFERLGSSHTIRVDVRVVAATNRDLEESVRKGSFRSDLFYRLSIFPISLPPLRERRDDIPLLATHFVKQLATKFGKKIESISQDMLDELQNYSWPGNIRELRNIIERAVITTQGPRLRLTDGLEQKVDQAIAISTIESPDPIGAETLEESQRSLILQALEKTYWKIEGANGAAQMLGIHPNTLRSRMKKLRISKPQFKIASERGGDRRTDG